MKPSLSPLRSLRARAPALEATGTKPRRWARILKRVVLALLIIFLVLVYVVLPLWFSSVVTNAKTRRMDLQLTETPADYKAEFREVEFQTSDGVKISGWLMPSRGKRATVIYSHGLFRSRRELLQRAVDIWDLGYGALLYDSRNHGDSGTARVSFGYNERLDAEAAIQFLRTNERSEDRIVLFGISMGAATALLAAAETTDVAAVISDSSFLSFKDTVDHHVKLFLRLPAFPLSQELRYLIEWRAGFDGSRLDALDAVRRIGDRPALFIAAAHDKRMPPELANKLFQASTSPKRDLLIIDGPGSDIHGHAYQADRKLYIDTVARFLESALGN
jgi:fermentation-respiration switch protein FrsA (DUF1100 family)